MSPALDTFPESAALAVNVSATKKKILEPLNEQQKPVVLNYEGPSLVEAGPGAGKTKTVVSRAAYMIADGVDASSILLFSFTRKAANEIKERIMAMVGEEASPVMVSTYHSFCARQLRLYHKYIGLSRRFTIIDSEDKTSMLRDIMKQLNLETDITVSQIGSKISGFKDKYLTPEQAKVFLQQQIAEGKRKSTPNDDMIIAIYYRYQQSLKDSNAVDFDDLIFYMVYILENFPNVKQQIQNKWKYITADEVQDSSIVDSRLIFNLMNMSTKNLCLVGDSDQAIYGFRGANASNIYACANYFNFRVFNLEQNYRSSQNIVNASQSLIAKNEQLNDKSIFSKNAIGDKLMVLSCDNALTEASKVSLITSKLIELTKNTNKPFKYSDIAILCRTNRLSRPIEDAFLRAQIPYEMVNGTGFYERTEIKDIMSYLQFIENPSNLIALKRIINVPKRKIGDAAITQIETFLMTAKSRYDIMSLVDVLNELTSLANSNVRFKNGLLNFISTIQEIKSLIDTGAEPARIVEKILDSINYKKYLSAKDKDTADDRWDNIQELINIASNHIDLTDFIDSMTLNSPEDEEKNPNKVHILTMHSSKGLEYRAVFIIGANEGVCPHKRSTTPEAIQEERRLFYVAMTRAKEVLIITYPNVIQSRNNITSAAPSRFISQIDVKYITKCGEPQKH